LKYEYERLEMLIDGKDEQVILETRGDLGWQLVHVIVQHPSEPRWAWWYFKRLKSSVTRNSVIDECIASLLTRWAELSRKADRKVVASCGRMLSKMKGESNED
jgi:hypothetical protein